MNSVNLIGRITNDVRMSPGNVVDLYIAENDRREDGLLHVVAFGRKADDMVKFFRKGDRIALTGRVDSQRSHNDMRIVLDRYDLLGGQDEGMRFYGRGRR